MLCYKSAVYCLTGTEDMEKPCTVMVRGFFYTIAKLYNCKTKMENPA